MTDSEMKAVREVCAAASEGPWEVDDTDGRAEIVTHDGYAVAYPAEHKSMHTIIARGRDCSIADARFIAAARTGWPEALDEIERLNLARTAAPFREAISQQLVDDNIALHAEVERLRFYETTSAAEAIRERDALRAEVDRLRADATPGLIETVRREARQWQANHDERKAERDALRAEVDRMTRHVAHNDEEYLTMKQVLRAEHEACKTLREQLAAMTTARDEACDLAEGLLAGFDVPSVKITARIAELRRVGAAK